jgi:hypothetical protein
MDIGPLCRIYPESHWLKELDAGGVQFSTLEPCPLGMRRQRGVVRLYVSRRASGSIEKSSSRTETGRLTITVSATLNVEIDDGLAEGKELT